MFSQEQLRKYADILLWGMQTARSRSFQAGDLVLIRFDPPGRRLAEILFDMIVESGYHPIQRINATPRMEHSFFAKGNDEQLAFIPPGDEDFYSNLHGSISILAPESLTHLQDIEPDRIGKTVLARKRLRDILDERENRGKFGWTLGLLTTPELAQNAGLSEEAYTEQIIKACYLDHEDPVTKWRAIYKEAGAIKEFLNSMDVERFRIRSERCDLSLTPGKDRRWVGLSGHNIPSFELFTSPDWRRTEGVFFMNQPSFRSGNLVTNLRLEFKEGVVTDVQAESGEDFVKKQIAMDANANKLGEFSLTDKRFSRIDRFMAHTLFDENFGGSYGNCHVALGASYAETYVHGGEHLTAQKKEELGFNDSALHWDLVNTEPKTVEAVLRSGETRIIYQDGSFVLEG